MRIKLHLYLSLVLILLGLLPLPTQAQNGAGAGFYFRSSHTRFLRLPFKLYNNLVVVPALMNNHPDTLNFVIDTGVGPSIILDTTLIQKLDIDTNVRSIEIKGAFKEIITEGYLVPFMNIRIGGLSTKKQTVIFLKEDLPHISKYSGIKVHGIVGYDFFRNMVVDIDYDNKNIFCYTHKKFYRKKRFFKRRTAMDINFHNNKPYIQVMATHYDTLNNLQTTPLEVLLDTGAGFTLSVENKDVTSAFKSEGYAGKKIGTAITGNISGKVGKIPQLAIGDFQWKDVVISSPSESRNKELVYDGILGVGVIARFRIAFDYANEKIYVQPSQKHLKPFEYALSGLDIVGVPPTYKNYIIAEVAEGSPAFQAGLRAKDQIISVNDKLAKDLTIGEIYEMVDSNVGTKVNLLIRREGSVFLVSFRLEKLP